MRCFVTPVVIRATEIVTKRLKNISGSNTRQIFNRFSTEVLVLRTPHKIKKVLKSWSLRRRFDHWFKRRDSGKKPCDKRRSILLLLLL
jgi:hypothetical protein